MAKPSNGSTEEDLLHLWESMFDVSPNSEPKVEINSLRRLAKSGIPSSPKHFRPTAWSILLGSLSNTKAEWSGERKSGRAKYRDFAKKFLGEVATSGVPTTPLSSNDKLLVSISQDVQRTQGHLDFFKQPTHSSSTLSASSSTRPAAMERQPSDLPDGDTVTTKNILKQRLLTLAATTRIQRPFLAKVDVHVANNQSENNIEPPSPNPSIQSDGTVRQAGAQTPPAALYADLPSLSLTVSPPSISPMKRGTTPHSLSSTAYPTSIPSIAMQPPTPTSTQADLHSDCLIRILYIFSLMHSHLPYTQGFSEILAPMYWVFASGGSEDDSFETEYAEEDSFWAFVGLMSEVGDVVTGSGAATNWEDETQTASGTERDIRWAMRRLSKRLKWADDILWEDLKRKNLDPSSPFYSYRWIAVLLSQDFPLETIVRIWDSILSEPVTTRSGSPKLDFLIDICTAMILLQRKHLIAAGGRSIQHPPRGLWTETEFEQDQFGPAFVEGMTILQNYPLERVGVERILKLALESRERRMLSELSGDGPEEDDVFKPPSKGATVVSSLAEARKRFFASQNQPPPVVPEPLALDQAETISEFGGIEKSPSAPGAASTYFSRWSTKLSESDAAAAAFKASSNLTAAALLRYGASTSSASGGDGEELVPGRARSFSKDSVSDRFPEEVLVPQAGGLMPSPITAHQRSSSPRPEFGDPPPETDGLQKRNSGEFPLTPTRPSPNKRMSLQERLALTTATLPASHLPLNNATPGMPFSATTSTPSSVGVINSPSSGGPKPLLLSHSARPASLLSPSATPVSLPSAGPNRPPWASGRRSPSMSSRAGSPPDRASSPFLSDAEGSVVVPIGARSNRSSMDEGSTPKFLKTMPGMSLAALRLRDNTPGSPSKKLTGDDNFTRPLPRSPARRSIYSDSEGGNENGNENRKGTWPTTGSSVGGSDSESRRSDNESVKSAGWTMVDDTSKPTRPSIITQGWTPKAQPIVEASPISEIRSDPSTGPPRTGGVNGVVKYSLRDEPISAPSSAPSSETDSIRSPSSSISRPRGGRQRTARTPLKLRDSTFDPTFTSDSPVAQSLPALESPSILNYMLDSGTSSAVKAEVPQVLRPPRGSSALNIRQEPAFPSPDSIVSPSHRRKESSASSIYNPSDKHESSPIKRSPRKQNTITPSTNRHSRPTSAAMTSDGDGLADDEDDVNNGVDMDDLLESYE